jgi:D-sedoheptulose 7-phosphate isomerase
METWKNNFQAAQTLLQEFTENQEQQKKCFALSELLIKIFQKDHNVFICGNGGSHCDAMHFAEELTGRFHKDRRPLGALALGDSSHITCTSNDYGFEHIFARQLEGLGKKNDLLIALSTSGNSLNIIRAIECAQKKGIQTVALLGHEGGKIKPLVDLAIVISATRSDRIQEMHIKILHIAIETVERALFPENYR